VPLYLILGFYRKRLGIAGEVINNNKIVEAAISRGNITREPEVNINLFKDTSRAP
jgi:hypothetical protein